MKVIHNIFSLENKTILVTGASSGIGKAIAQECSHMGADLIITGRNEERLKETFGLMKGDRHSYIAADLNNKEGIEKLISSLPQLNGLVLCAGIVEMWPVNYATKERFNKIFDTNFFSPIEILRLIVKKKLFNHSLSVVAIDSIAGNEDFVIGNGIYGAGKAALKSFLKFCALEMASKNIRINTVSPGLILTPMHTNGAVEEDLLEKAVDKIPLKRWGLPQDIAPAVVYLLSDASSYVTGTDIKIDGGCTI